MTTIDGATGVFLTVKGEPPPSRVDPVPAGAGPSLAALGVSSPVMDMAAELIPLQKVDASLVALRR